MGFQSFEATCARQALQSLSAVVQRAAREHPRRATCAFPKRGDLEEAARLLPAVPANGTASGARCEACGPPHQRRRGRLGRVQKGIDDPGLHVPAVVCARRRHRAVALLAPLWAPAIPSHDDSRALLLGHLRFSSYCGKNFSVSTARHRLSSGNLGPKLLSRLVPAHVNYHAVESERSKCIAL